MAIKGVEFEMKKRWNSGSDLVEKLFDNVEKYKKIEKECYKTCNEILKDEMVDMDDLYHAKAVLEQNMETRSGFNGLVNQSLSVIAVVLAALAFVGSISNSKLEITISGSIAFVIIIICSIIYYGNDRSPIKYYMYYVYSLICDEIENRHKEKLAKKTHGKNKSKKGKNKCQHK